MSNKLNRDSLRGVAAIPLVLVLLTSLALIIGAVGKLALNRNRIVAADGFDKRARYAAYAGCQYGLLALGNNVAFAPDEKIILNLPSDPQTHFELEIFNNYDGGLGTVYTAPDGTQVPQGFAFVRALGVSSQGSTSYNTAVSGLAERGDRYFNHAAVGHDNVSMRGGSSTDSWRSFRQVAGAGGTVGYTFHQFGAADSPPDTGPADIVSNSNSSSPPAILMADGSRVWGTPITGPLSDPNVAVEMSSGASSAKPPIAGTSVKRIPRNRPPINPTEAVNPASIAAGANVTLPPGAYTSLTVGPGATLTLEEEGVYMFTGDVVINGGNVIINHSGSQAIPETLGAVVYFGQNVTISNGARVNENGLPQRLQVYAMGNGQKDFEAEMTISTGSQVWGVVSGRSLQANINAAELFGSIKGRKVELDGAKIHYDRSLHGQALAGLSAWKLLGVVETNLVDTTVTTPGGAGAAGAAGTAGAAGGDATGGDASGGGFGGDAAAAAGSAVGAAGGGDAAGGDAASGGDAVAGAGDAAAAGGPGGDANGGDAAAAGGDAVVTGGEAAGDGDGDAVDGGAAGDGDGDAVAG